MSQTPRKMKKAAKSSEKSALRRRHHGRFVVPPVPPEFAAFAAAALLFVIVVFHCQLSTPTHDPPVTLLLKPAPVVVTGALSVPNGSDGVDRLWRSPHAKNFHGCSSAGTDFKAAAEANTLPNRYIMIATSGGLNQQRTGIIDAVVAARILNATLVVPQLDQKSFWHDNSDFAEIFDVDWFILVLRKDVKIVKELPPQIDGKNVIPYSIRVPRKCSPQCYQSRVLPALLKKHAVQLTKFDYRLANKLDPDYQKLRCRVNYHALKFTDPIVEMGEKLIERMRRKSERFIALHLRFEPDMLAFSGCYYGGGEKEQAELGAIRKMWKTLRVSNPEKERRHGKCPLTPEEVGLMLRAVGFGSDVYVYVASGEVYGGESALAPLKALFPHFHSKESLATKEELAPFTSFSSRMAALDFIVCDGSDVFVTNNNGNMARMLAGRRRYFGHKPTIRPNARKLYPLFLNRSSMSWEEFSSGVRTVQRGFMGLPGEGKPGRGEFHENPADCICEKPVKSKRVSKANDGMSNNDIDWRELDYGENTPLGSAATANDRDADYNSEVQKTENSDLDLLISD